jgi:putative ABC transport system permease protein
MDLIKLIIRNVFRHRLRSILTLVGVAIAMCAFGILRTLVGAWYMGVEASAADRLVVRNKISLIYSLPLAYRTKILQVRGVTGIAYGSWYGGIYKDKKNFFPQLAVSGSEYLDLFPEFLLPREVKLNFDKQRNAAIAGRKTAERYGWKVGDVIPLQGTIYPGSVELVLSGIYKGARKTADETVFFFRYDYLNEQSKKVLPERTDRVGWYLVRIDDPGRSAEISREIDALFESSLAETRTETEKAFQMGFVSMTEAILGAIRIISIVVIAIILLVLANTMAMTARERSGEYAVLKTMGFGPRFLSLLIGGESVAIALLGGAAGALMTFPAGRALQVQLRSFLPVFEVTSATLMLILGTSLLVGLAAAIPPVLTVTRIGIAEGLRHVG